MSTMREYKVTVQTEVTLSGEDICEMLETAGYSIGYWAQSLDWDEDTESMTVVEVDDQTGFPKAHIVPFANIAKAFGKLADPHTDLVGRTVRTYFAQAVAEGVDGHPDLGFIDGDAADCLVQVAALQSVIYG